MSDSTYYALGIPKGSTFRSVIAVQQPAGVPLNLTGCSAHMNIERAGAGGSIVAALTIANGGVVIDDTLGTVSLYLSDTDVAKINSECTHQVLLRLGNGDVLPLLHGPVTIT